MFQSTQVSGKLVKYNDSRTKGRKKLCPKCCRWKNFEAFYLAKVEDYFRFRNYCKKCCDSIENFRPNKNHWKIYKVEDKLVYANSGLIKDKTRKCSACEEWQEFQEFFLLKKPNGFYFRSYCKTCSNARCKARLRKKGVKEQQHRNFKIAENGLILLECKTCKEFKEHNEFWKAKDNRFNRRASCAHCMLKNKVRKPRIYHKMNADHPWRLRNRRMKFSKIFFEKPENKERSL